MNPLAFFRRNDAAMSVENGAELVSRYKQLREVSRKLHDKLVERLPEGAILEGARKLGIVQEDILVFNSEEELPVLMDYCIYNVRRKGRNAIEQYLIDSEPDPDSDEMTCLRAMQDATYSLCIVESVIRELGVTVRDLCSNETILIVDMGFSRTGRTGLVFASRLLSHDGFCMTGGAPLPFGIPTKDQQETFMSDLSRADPEDGRYHDPAPFIRALLDRNCSSHVQYDDPPATTIRREQDLPHTHPTKISRNAPCSCGSGKKFKRCCLKRS